MDNQHNTDLNKQEQPSNAPSLEQSGGLSVAFHTLGCRLNQYEIDAIASDLVKRGHSIVENTDHADVHIVNTCTVTQKAARKSRNTINRARQLSTKFTILTGCLATEEKEDFKTRYDAVIVDNDRKSHIPDIVSAYLQGELVDPDNLDPELFAYQPQTQIFHTRSLIKIQDGCDNFCTFCIIPSVRGRASSRPPKDVLEHVRTAIRTGSKELVITGVNITRYRYEDWDFYRLIEAMLEIPGDFQVRLSSVEPEIDINRFRTLITHEKLCPHLHLCLQSGSTKILLQMRREYTIRDFMQIVETTRSVDPDYNITTDIIVGFPGESDQDFSDSLRIAREIHFGHIHVFPYSKRSGTRAERFSHSIDQGQKKERVAQLINLSKTLTQEYRQRFIPKDMLVLTEETKHRDATISTYGLNKYYVPVLMDGMHPVNSILPVRAQRILSTGELLAIPISSNNAQ